MAVFLTVSGAACGAERDDLRDLAGKEVASEPGSDTTRTTIYLLTDDGSAPIGVRRTISAESPYAREALRALLAGPTREEAQNGITTAIPAGTRLLAMTFERHGVDELINLSRLSEQGVDVLQQHRIITQLVRTLIGVSGIERVWLLNEGRPWGLTLRNGRIVNGPFDYGSLVGLNIDAGCPGTETVPCDSFVALP
ncbi:MAG: GerMN domain-containing protein [Gaiellaceae bacterium]